MARFRLSGMKLDEVSLVRSGDNPGAKVVIAKAAAPEETDDEFLQWIAEGEVSKVKSSTYPSLERKPGKQNWVDHAGGLPSYIERIAKHLHYEQGMSIGHAIATAVNQVKKWAAGGKDVSPTTRAKAAKALTEWEAKKAKGKVKKEGEDYKKPGLCECGVRTDSPQHAKKHKEWEAKMAKERVKKDAPGSQVDPKNPDDTDDPTDDQSGEDDGSTDTLGDDGTDDQEENEVPDEVQKDDLPAVVRTYIEALEAKVEELTKAAKPEDPLKVALAKADPTIRAVIEKQQEEIKEATALAKAEREARLEREFLAKAENLRMISETPSELAGTLRKLYDANPEEAAKVEKMLQTANTQIAKGNLFTELGAGGAEITISKSVEGRAEQLMKADPALSREQAIARVYADDPNLYEQELKEA